MAAACLLSFLWDAFGLAFRQSALNFILVMLTGNNTQSTLHPPKPTIPERLKKIESLLMTACFAALYQHDTNGAGQELYNISEATRFASEMLGDIAEELETAQSANES